MTEDTKTSLKPDPAEMERIKRGVHHDPFSVLGNHRCGKSDWRINAYIPGVSEVAVVPDGEVSPKTMEPLGDDGFYSVEYRGQDEPFRYQLRVENDDGEEWSTYDPYQFPTVLSDYDIHLIKEGRNYQLYETLGAHRDELLGVEGFSFSVWAPNARRVSVVGDFNGWDGRRHMMRVRPEAGVWEMFVPELDQDEQYKYEIKTDSGEILEKADPLAFYAEKRPGTASKTYDVPDYDWNDEDWILERDAEDPTDQPISAYEVHLPSWRRNRDGEMMNYRDLADELVDYLDEMNYTHVELMPVQEHPLDASWGYQITGHFAPTSRLGKPEDFMYFVDTLHENGFGVILDWVPGHFPMDDHGLYQFDGTHLYEHADPRKGYHPDWHTAIPNFGRREVRNFFVSSALFWLDKYHVDGLRVDAVASMLYLDYSREDGEWIPNKYGGRENLEAIHFIRDFNEEVEARFPGALTIAEESTSWGGVTDPTYDDGLGFDLKWNMGWMNDTLEYLKENPVHRKYHHDELTFLFYFAFDEQFMLVLSHDEVVHGKRSLLEKMPGDDWQKFANLRLLLGFQMAHPGKQLTFMGNEFAQRSEWRFDQSLDWHLTDHGNHDSIRRLQRELNEHYTESQCLWDTDFSGEGFQWIDYGDSANSVISFIRGESDGSHRVFVLNFTPVVRENYRIGVPDEEGYEEVLNTDAERFGGSGVTRTDPVVVEETSFHGREQSIELTLPPLAMVVLRPADL